MRLTGQFLNHFSLLQDNRTHQQRIGYVVLTLFEDAASGALIWVNRGWTLGHSDRNQLPQITPVQGTVSIQGRLRVVENNRWLKALSNNQNEWPFVVLTQNNPSINRMLEQRLATHIAVPTLVLEEGSDYGFTQSWRQQVTISPDKHIAYAVQWFMLAATLLVMVSIFYYKQRKNDVKQS